MPADQSEDPCAEPGVIEYSSPDAEGGVVQCSARDASGDAGDATDAAGDVSIPDAASGG
jgi:hypothetical protein